MSMRLAAPLLRPPEHRTGMLATPQTHWLNSTSERILNWPDADSQQAQTLANQGEFSSYQGLSGSQQTQLE